MSFKTTTIYVTLFLKLWMTCHVNNITGHLNDDHGEIGFVIMTDEAKQPIQSH